MCRQVEVVVVVVELGRTFICVTNTNVFLVFNRGSARSWKGLKLCQVDSRPSQVSLEHSYIKKEKSVFRNLNVIVLLKTLCRRF